VGALGFLSTQSEGIILLIFLTVGLGLAAPYLLLSWEPRWLKFLPRPGVWMERFKIAMGFPMLATAVWLLNLLPLHYGRRSLWLGIFLVVLGLAAWVYGQFVQRAVARRGLGLAAVLVLVIGGYVFIIERQLDWRSPVRQSVASKPLKESSDGIEWQPWSREAVEEARAAGHPVLVDFTADWCLNCQVNKKIAIEVPSVRAKIKELKVVPLLADNSLWPDSIAKELSRFGRGGVPLVLVYPKNAAQPPIVLPPILTPGTVLNALEQAVQ
jgi:thiol:disulfide interchange protein DsbD